MVHGEIPARMIVLEFVADFRAAILPRLLEPLAIFDAIRPIGRRCLSALATDLSGSCTGCLSNALADTGSSRTRATWATGATGTTWAAALEEIANRVRSASAAARA
jgi:hypothetical protein